MGPQRICYYSWDRTFRDCHWLDPAPCYVVQAGAERTEEEKDFPDHRREQIESLHDPVSSGASAYLDQTVC